MAQYKFPTEVVNLPSKGKLYSKDNPLSKGEVELKYMTAKEKDILTSINLIRKGIVIDKVLESLIVDKKYVLGGSPGLDITKVIVEKLNKDLPSLNLK